MILSYPVSLPTITISIRDPELGDTITHDSQAIVIKNRGGEPLSVNADWPINITRSLTFRALKKARKDDFISFIKSTTGLEIAISDTHEGVWFGYIISNSLEIITVRDNCSYDLSFDFIGRKIS